MNNLNNKLIEAEVILEHFGVQPLPLVRLGSIMVEQYTGVRALFNGDLHKIDPNYAPREDWIIYSPNKMEYKPKQEFTQNPKKYLEQNIAQAKQFIQLKQTRLKNAIKINEPARIQLAEEKLQQAKEKLVLLEKELQVFEK